MTRDGFKRAVVMGLAASALLLAGGCRDERGRQGPQYVPSQQQEQGTGGAGQSGQQPVDVNPQPDQEGFKTVPEQQELPSGIQDESRGQGGSGQERSVDVNPLPEEEGFQSVPERQELPHGVGEDPERRKDAQ
ncbi:hypothetical protein F0U60_51180 [Archangium minus]|uniref:Lipoprotein n=1 Tax=Archangium minus TaxID=83450 RepID=A0ABY9X866_9BACT|nr:hypothetical protein F0U60_51180 [Archangium minus]